MTMVGETSGTEAPFTLNDPAPRTLGLFDQLGFWGNLGVSLLGFGGAIAVLAPAGAPPLSMPAALSAMVVGTVLGAALLGWSLVLGERTGAPAMVVIRGLLGARASGLPTLLNIAQCLGWGAFELVVIAGGCTALSRGTIPTWPAITGAGVISTALTLRPLGVIRLLRRYVSVLVVIATMVLAVDLLAHPVPMGQGSWNGFWQGVDAALAVAISWVPLGADYARHSRTARAAFLGGFVGFGLTQIACYAIGLLALAQVARDPSRVFDLFLAMPMGGFAFAVLVLREGDQSFANVYSTAVSIQNLRPNWDRRILTVIIGALTTAAALMLDIGRFAGFLYLIGAIFVPLSGALLAAWARTGGRGWNITATAPTRPAMAAAWASGFVVYQLINPGTVPGWSDFWAQVGSTLQVSGDPWLSASIAAFVVSATVAYPLADRNPSATPEGTAL